MECESMQFLCTWVHLVVCWQRPWAFSVWLEVHELVASFSWTMVDCSWILSNKPLAFWPWSWSWVRQESGVENGPVVELILGKRGEGVEKYRLWSWSWVGVEKYRLWSWSWVREESGVERYKLWSWFWVREECGVEDMLWSWSWVGVEHRLWRWSWVREESGVEKYKLWGWSWVREENGVENYRLWSWSRVKEESGVEKDRLWSWSWVKEESGVEKYRLWSWSWVREESGVEKDRLQILIVGLILDNRREWGQEEQVADSESLTVEAGLGRLRKIGCSKAQALWDNRNHS